MSDDWIGRKLGGRYEILSHIADGGMGAVYRARQLSTDRPVAVKMLHASRTQHPNWEARFRREAEACALLSHPNLVHLYDFGQSTRGDFFMVMELLEGQSLDDVVRQGPMGASRVLRILMQCCAALSEAHERGIIHRDIKPQNIMLREVAGATDFVKVFDFSIAKQGELVLTEVGQVWGTPQFMSPEQCMGSEVDGRSDLYSLGITAYQMLSGNLPFQHKHPMELLRMHKDMVPPPLPDYVPGSIAKVVLACLAKSPAERPPSASALLEACKVWLRELDPDLDITQDPVLKNTLIDTGDHRPPGEEFLENSAPSPSQATMLGVSPLPGLAKHDKRTSVGFAGQARVRQAPKATKASPQPKELVPQTSPAALPKKSSIQRTRIGSAPGLKPAAAGNNPVLTEHQRSGAPVGIDLGLLSTESLPSPMARSMPAPLPAPPPPKLLSWPFVALCLLVIASFGSGSFYLVKFMR